MNDQRIQPKPHHTGGTYLHRIASVARTIAIALLIVPQAAHAMEFEVRGTAIILTGPVTGVELRLLSGSLSEHPELTTVVLKNSTGGDAMTGYLVGEFIRDKKLNTALSGYCISSCSRMFLGGVQRQYSDDQPLEKTFVGLHGNYANDGSLLSGRMGYLKDWVIKYSDNKANPELVEQWVHIPNNRGYAAFYHRDAEVLPGSQKVMLCQGTEERGKRLEQCARPEMGDALANGIVTTWDVLRVKTQGESRAPVATTQQGERQ